MIFYNEVRIIRQIKCATTTSTTKKIKTEDYWNTESGNVFGIEKGNSY